VRRFDFDGLKLDRSFVAGLGTDAGDTALAAAAISMGDALNMEVVAEGVETEAQARQLRALGCRLAQGFLFARPLDPAAMRALIVARCERGERLPAGEGGEPAARQDDADAGARSGLAPQIEVPAQGVDSLPR
jgi:predicted signal transduction protein with EAL and GGDEF domain